MTSGNIKKNQIQIQIEIQIQIRVKYAVEGGTCNISF